MVIKRIKVNSIKHSPIEIRSFSTLQKWITEYELQLPLLIQQSKCKKWYKLFSRREVPYPCVCPVRDEHCIELEMYYELLKIENLHNKQKYFKQAIQEFNSINMHNRESILSWIGKYEAIGSKLFFAPTITILLKPQRNEKLIILLNPDEFQTVIQFQEIFNTVYYSEEFQTNNNL